MSDGANPFIEIKEISKIFIKQTGEELLAIENISFEVEDGEFISIVGPSGCGKSTLLKIIAGLLQRNAGSIRIGNQEVNSTTTQIGMIFQNPVLLPWKTVFENVMLPIHVLRLPPAQYMDRAKDLIKLVGLEGCEDSYPFELSGGMAQRNAIVRALVHDPKILLADEPFGALDAMTREQMNIDIQRIWMESKKTILFVTHSIPEAVFLSDRVLVLSHRPSRVVDFVQVDLPRPRDIEMMGTNVFGDYTARIRSHFKRSQEQN